MLLYIVLCIRFFFFFFFLFFWGEGVEYLVVAQSYCRGSKVLNPICYYKAVKGSQILLIRHFTEIMRDD